MKFRIPTRRFAGVLRGPARTAGPGALAVDQCVRIEADSSGNVVVTAKQDQTSAVRSVTETAETTQPGVAVVPARLLNEIVNLLPDPLEIETDSDEIVLRAQRCTFSLRCMPTESWTDPQMPDSAPVVVPAEALAAAFAEAANVASDDDSRPILTGVNLAPSGNDDGRLRAVGTDSYRLAYREASAVDSDEASEGLLADGKQALIPASGLDEMLRLFRGCDTFTVRGDDKAISFEADHGETRSVVSLKLLAGDYPSWESLIPDSSPVTVKADRSELMSALRGLHPITKQSGVPLRCEVHRDRLLLRVAAKDFGDGETTISADVTVASDYDHDENDAAVLSVSFNAEYLIAGIESVNGDIVVLGMTDAAKVTAIRSAEPPENDGVYLLMPVRA